MFLSPSPPYDLISVIIQQETAIVNSILVIGHLSLATVLLYHSYLLSTLFQHLRSLHSDYNIQQLKSDFTNQLDNLRATRHLITSQSCLQGAPTRPRAATTPLQPHHRDLPHPPVPLHPHRHRVAPTPAPHDRHETLDTGANRAGR